jgi:Ca2+-binding EF-hand superfamily protein
MGSFGIGNNSPLAFQIQLGFPAQSNGMFTDTRRANPFSNGFSSGLDSFIMQNSPFGDDFAFGGANDYSLRGYGYPPPHPPGLGTQFFDTNKDDKVSKAEWDAGFTKLDKNADGSLSNAELRAARQTDTTDQPTAPTPQSVLTAADTDKNNSISTTEWQAYTPTGSDGQPLNLTAAQKTAVFNRIDTNDDSKITLAELTADKKKFDAQNGHPPDFGFPPFPGQGGFPGQGQGGQIVQILLKVIQQLLGNRSSTATV